MKCALLSSLAAAGAVCIAVTATECELNSIENTLRSNSTIGASMGPAQMKCKEDTGVDIFAISDFPTKATALKIQKSDKGCNVVINLVNVYANTDAQCTIEINGINVTYGRLISDFLDGKIGNETDTSSDSSNEIATISSESESGSTSSSSSDQIITSGASTKVLSLTTCGAITAIAFALR